jgi:hypothetical protein
MPHSITVDPGDMVAVCEGFFLAATWVWILRAKRKWPGWREKLSLYALLCASVSILADLILTSTMHFRGDSTFTAELFVATLVASLLLGVAGIVLAFLGRGSPRIAALIWSGLTLFSVAASVVMAATR